MEMVVPKWAEAAARNDGLVLRTLRECPDWFEEKVLSRLVEQDGCRVWTGGNHRSGYGSVHLPKAVTGGRTVRASVHRVVYLATHDEIPYGMQLDHTCEVKLCADVSHLRAVTDRQNEHAKYEEERGSGLCTFGHEFGAEGNVTPSVAARGKQDCRECHRASAAVHGTVVRSAAAGIGLGRMRYRAEHGLSLSTALAHITRDQAVTALAARLDGYTLAVVAHGSGERARLAAEALVIWSTRRWPSASIAA